MDAVQETLAALTTLLSTGMTLDDVEQTCDEADLAKAGLAISLRLTKELAAAIDVPPAEVLQSVALYYESLRPQ